MSTAMTELDEMTASGARSGPAEVIQQAAGLLRGRAGEEQPRFAQAVAGLLEEIAAGPNPAPAWTVIGALRIARACLADAGATGSGVAPIALFPELAEAAR